MKVLTADRTRLICICLLCVCLRFRDAYAAYSVNIHSVGGSVVDKNNLVDLSGSSMFTSGEQLAMAEELSPVNSSRCAQRQQ